MEPDRQALIQATPSPTGSGQRTLSETFLTSEVYVRAARADIQSLLSLFSQQWITQSQLHGRSSSVLSAEGPASVASESPAPLIIPRKAVFRKPRGVNKSGPSAFAIFKHCWVHLGWDKVHLAMVDPCLKTEWFRVVSRLFMERLTLDQPHDLGKAGALLGLYTFWASQPTSIPTEHILLDLSLLESIKAAPALLVAAVDGQALDSTADPMIRASDDLFMAVNLMCRGPTGPAFFLAPEEAVHHIPLPPDRSLPTKKGSPLSVAPHRKRGRTSGRPIATSSVPLFPLAGDQSLAPKRLEPLPSYVAIEPSVELDWLRGPAEGEDTGRTQIDLASPPMSAIDHTEGIVSGAERHARGSTRDRWAPAPLVNSPLTPEEEEGNQFLISLQPTDSQRSLAGRSHISRNAGAVQTQIPVDSSQSALTMTAGNDGSDYFDFLGPDEP